MSAAAPRILLAGATGLVGALALRALLDARAARLHIVAPTRRPLAVEDPRLLRVELAVGAEGSTAPAVAWLPRERIDCYACALGTTLRAAGSQAAFRAVDHDLVLALARIARDAGARQAVVVSSVGANAASSNFYLRVKGETEDALAALGFDRLDLLQPGLLLGERAGDARPGERLAQTFAPLFNPLLFGPLRRYGAIPAESVARALVALIGAGGSGLRRHENPAIAKLASG